MIRAFLRYSPDSVSKFATASYFKIGRFLFSKAHSYPQTINFSTMKVRILPALKDNYMYLIIDTKTNEAAAVDPIEPRKVMSAVGEENVKLTTVLTTHHHWDHAGGNQELLQLQPGLKVVGGDDRIACLNKKVSHNDELSIGSLKVQCLFTPCHTKGHICYFIPQDPGPSAVFTGDTLFSGGCGKFFEGTASEMYSALIDTLSELPDSTNVFSGHEYTVSNLKFAKSINPRNTDIADYLEYAIKQRQKQKPTLPSTIALRHINTCNVSSITPTADMSGCRSWCDGRNCARREKKINPFMQVCEAEMQEIIGQTDPIHVMRVLREMKDNFKG